MEILENELIFLVIKMKIIEIMCLLALAGLCDLQVLIVSASMQSGSIPLIEALIQTSGCSEVQVLLLEDNPPHRISAASRSLTAW